MVGAGEEKQESWCSAQSVEAAPLLTYSKEFAGVDNKVKYKKAKVLGMEG